MTSLVNYKLQNVTLTSPEIATLDTPSIAHFTISKHEHKVDDYSRWYNDYSKQFMERDYLLPDQTIDQRINVIAQTAENILNKPGFANKFKEYMSKGWYSLSTPVWINFGTNRGLPISCFSSYIPDSMPGILYSQAEVGMMTKLGGGTSGYFGALRARGESIKDNGVSSGAVHFIPLFDTVINTISQGSARRGNFAAYLDLDHPDILEFLTIRSEGSNLQDISFGVCVKDDWLEEMIAGDTQKRQIWAKVLEVRANTGYPYIFFTDNVNKNAPDAYKDIGLRIHGSNLCSEITLSTNSEESFVCCLSSMNILYFDEWKNTDAVETLTYFLDAVMEEFITKAREIPFMKRSVQFAERQRALGIGWLGYHSYLQSKMIAFESTEAKLLNGFIAKTIRDQSLEASQKMAEEYGEPYYLRGYGRRNMTLTAIAPTKSSSFILGQVSEGIEPIRSNYFTKDLAKGKFIIKNPFLVKLLDEKNMNTPDVWDSIIKQAGSVQHLDFLTLEEKFVFKTMSEISPMELIIQASTRQKYIDQSQSLNLMIHPTVPVKDVNSLILEAWRLGVKTLYYQFSANAAQQFSRNILNCVSCE